MTRASAQRLQAGFGLLTGTTITLGIYQFAEWLALRWNPFL